MTAVLVVALLAGPLLAGVAAGVTVDAYLCLRNLTRGKPPRP